MIPAILLIAFALRQEVIITAGVDISANLMVFLDLLLTLNIIIMKYFGCCGYKLVDSK